MSENAFPSKRQIASEETNPSGLPALKRQPRITPREREVLFELTKGLTNKEIARVLGVSQHTVRDYIAGLLAKFNVSNRVELCVTVLGMRTALGPSWPEESDTLA